MPNVSKLSEHLLIRRVKPVRVTFRVSSAEVFHA